MERERGGRTPGLPLPHGRPPVHSPAPRCRFVAYSWTCRPGLLAEGSPEGAREGRAGPAEATPLRLAGVRHATPHPPVLDLRPVASSSQTLWWVPANDSEREGEGAPVPWPQHEAYADSLAALRFLSWSPSCVL